MNPPATPSPTWFEHVDLMQAIIVGLVALVCWFAIRTLRKIDVNQTLLFEKQSRLSEKVSKLEGRCDAIHRNGDAK